MADWPSGTGSGDISRKQQKEQFVSNLEGTTMLEVYLVTTVVPIFVIFRQLVGFILHQRQVLLERNKGAQPRERKRGPKTASMRDVLGELFLDFTLIIVPTVACMTVLADYLVHILLVMLFLLAALVYSGKRAAGVPVLLSRPDLEVMEKALLAPRKPFLSSYRSTQMLTTCVDILAVDFQIFPRRYAKAETFGTGLLDIGVGSFVVANALVSRQAQAADQQQHQQISPLATLRRVSPLLFLGGARLLLTKGLDYQEHVGEYGVHWNFFFTLAAISLATSTITIPMHFSAPVGAAMLSAYQSLLSHGGWSEWLMSAERGSDLLSLNKEGAVSIFGYWSLYLMSMQLGRTVVAWKPGRLLHGRWKHVARTFALELALWIITVVLDTRVERVSRRSCNAAYVAWILALNLHVVALFLFADVAVGQRPSVLMKSLDANMLPSFLLANVLTGLTNMSMDTIAATPTTAFCLLLVYACALSAVTVLTAKSGIRLKFW